MQIMLPDIAIPPDTPAMPGRRRAARRIST